MNKPTYDLEWMQKRIEPMDKTQHIEILKILKKYPNIKINDNKSGVYINMSCLPEVVLEELYKYIIYICEQENSLNMLENQKKDIIKTYFDE